MSLDVTEIGSDTFTGVGINLLRFTITRYDIEKVFSALAVDERIDDDNDGIIDTVEQSFLDDVIGDAVGEFMQYAMHCYTEDALATSEWSKRQTAVIAAHLLSTRRGNPGQFCDAYDNVISTLEALCKTRWIPGLSPFYTPGPAMANLVVDQRHGEAKLRVVSSTQVGGSHPNQDIDDGHGFIR